MRRNAERLEALPLEDDDFFHACPELTFLCIFYLVIVGNKLGSASANAHI